MKFNYIEIPLKWYQKLYLHIMWKIYDNEYISYWLYPKYGNHKTTLNFVTMLERLKYKAKSPEEKAYYESVQNAYGEIMADLNLNYWS